MSQANFDHKDVECCYIEPQEDLDSLELAILTASKLPISDRVIGDVARSYQPTDEEHYLTLPDGRYVNKIYSRVKLRDFE